MPIRADDRRPPYKQLADELREAIKTGDYQPGQALPSTRQLMETHGLASLTVQRAIGVLRDEGIVVSEPGRGVFVNDAEPASTTETPNAPRTLDDALKMLAELNERLDRLEARTPASPSEPAAGPEPDPEPDRTPEIEP